MVIVKTEQAFSMEKWPIQREASELGFTPGCWPVRLRLQDPLGQSFVVQLDSADMSRDGEVTQVSYRPVDGIRSTSVVVLND